MPANVKSMKIRLSGNPFVDTGLGVLATLSGHKKIDDLTISDIFKVHKDGEILARRNSKLKSMTMIFTNNSIATNPSIPEKKRILYYSKLTTAILNSIGKENIPERCESCGNESSLDIDKLVRETLVPLGYTDSTKYVGRDWFPLAGSMGSDAQALSVASRAPNICARCLFAVHYLPLGVMLMNGRLAVFQSTSTEFWYSFVNAIVKKIISRISANVVDTLGSKEGNTAAISSILDIMRDMRDEIGPGVSLFMWRFSNSGNGPDCEISEIPNSALIFLQHAVRYDCSKEILQLIANDRKAGEYSFLNCISKSIDYLYLYPYKKFDGVSPELFVLYQVLVRGISTRLLTIAYNIARRITSKIQGKELEDLGKDLDSNNATHKQNTVRKIIVEMVSKKELAFTDYYELFFQNKGLNYDAWKFIKYYLHKTKQSAFQERLNREFPTISAGRDQTQQHHRQQILYIGSIIFSHIMANKGREKVEQALEEIVHGKITPIWLKRQFVKLGQGYEGFTYDEWKSLCFDRNGKEISYEILFQLRLLWTEWLSLGTTPKVNHPELSTVLQLETDLSSEHREFVGSVVSEYIAKRGSERFKKYVIDGLVKNELGLSWFREQFIMLEAKFSDDDYWDKFLTDDSGRSIRYLRLFQLTLETVNYFREHTFKQPLHLTHA